MKSCDLYSYPHPLGVRLLDIPNCRPSSSLRGNGLVTVIRPVEQCMGIDTSIDIKSSDQGIYQRDNQVASRRARLNKQKDVGLLTRMSSDQPFLSAIKWLRQLFN